MPPEPSSFGSAGVSLIAVLALAMLHIAAGRVRRRPEVRPRWLSAASGVSVAYVFVQLLPDLREGQELWLEARPERMFPWLERQVYLMALIGLVLALGLERFTSSQRNPQQARFWLHTTSFVVYNFLIGGFALRLAGVMPLLLGLLAFGAHFLVNDYSLQQGYGRAYERIGRWLFAGALLVGWLSEVLFELPAVLVTALLGLVAGGIVLNVIKEELPENGQGVFSGFVAGTVVYSILLLTLAYSQGSRHSPEPRGTNPCVRAGVVAIGPAAGANPTVLHQLRDARRAMFGQSHEARPRRRG